MGITKQFGGWNGSDIFSKKSCVVCGTEFQPSSGVHKFCSKQCKGKWKYITGVGNTENQYKCISGNWSKYFNRLVAQKHRNDLIASDCLELLEEQENRCALSGVLLTCNLEKGNISKTNASLDRIEAGGPYIKENIQLVCRALNSWRGDTPNDEFIWWCKQVANHCQEG